MATLQIPSIQPSVITPVRNTPLIFTHPAIDRGQPFVIDTGASSIKWPYKLNVNVTPTYAGEVVQILSVYVDAMTLSGQTRDAEQLRSIYSWFLRYMQIAGLADRNQQAVTFQYPERGWQFLLQPTKLPNFTYNRDLLAVEWSLEAEVVQDDNILSGYTMNGFTRAAFDPSLWDVGFNAEDPRVNPLSPFNSDPSTAQNLGNNFQSLIGAWSSGDFAHWAFDATQTPKANKLKQSKDYYTEIFGTDFLTKSKSGVNTGASPYGGPLNPTGPAAIAAMIASVFEKQGVPGELGVAVAMAESNLEPTRWQGSDPRTPSVLPSPPIYKGTGAGLFQTTDVGGGEDLLYKRAVTHYPDLITKWFTAVQQAEFAAQRAASSTHSSNLGQWGWNFQRPEHEAAYVAEINGLLSKAKALIKKGQAQTSLAGTSSQLAQKILNHPNYQGGDGGDLKTAAAGKSVINRGNQAVTIKRTMLSGLLTLLDSGFKITLSAMCSNHDVDGSGIGAHSQGYAFDVDIVDNHSILGGGSACEQSVLNLMRAANNTASIYQIINAGVGGGGPNVQANLNLIDTNGPDTHANPVGFYGQGTLDQHKNHVHIGYSN